MKKYAVLMSAITALFLSFGAHAQTSNTPVKFPDLKSTYLKTGDFVNVDNLKKIAVGLHKDQVRLLIGNPHFNEGVGSPHIWNYAFDFYTGKMGGDYITCQYQVQYDKNYRVAATFWKEQQCGAFLNDKAPTPVAARTPQVISLSGDGLFAFGRSGLKDLQPAGRENLRLLASQIFSSGLTKVNSVRITGYTDRFGSEKSNLALSRARAATVKSYLVQQGIDANLITTTGMGEANPVVNCPGGKTKAVIACLMPNRRIEVAIDAVK